MFQKIGDAVLRGIQITDGALLLTGSCTHRLLTSRCSIRPAPARFKFPRTAQDSHQLEICLQLHLTRFCTPPSETRAT